MEPGILPSDGRSTRPYGPCGASSRSMRQRRDDVAAAPALYCGLTVNGIQRKAGCYDDRRCGDLPGSRLLVVFDGVRGAARAHAPQAMQCSGSSTAFCGMALVKGTAMARIDAQSLLKGSGCSALQAYSHSRHPMHLSSFT